MNMAKYKSYVNGVYQGTVSFTDGEMEHLKKSGYAKKKGVTFRKVK